VSKQSRKPRYYDCPMCYRKLRLNGVRIPRHKDIGTGTLCVNSGGFIPEVKTKKEEGR